MRLIGAILALLLLAAAPARAGQVFDTIKARGSIACGVNVGTAGFSLVGPDGVWRGLDVDFCRALAAAVLGDPNKVRLVPLTAEQRFPALQAGEIDVLIRQTTYTLGRDTSMGLRMVEPNFYDGHAFMVRADAGISGLRGLDGMSICLVPGTTNEAVTVEQLRTSAIRFTPVATPRTTDMAAALAAGRCQAAGADGSSLAALRTLLERPDDYTILPQRISKEPYGPVVRRGDDEWFEVVRWVLMALVEAEELGSTSQNAETLRRTSAQPAIRRLLGVVPDLGSDLRLDPAWAYTMLRAVGNYGEIFERNLGAGSALKLERGLNRLWTQGGLMYAWPMR
jgi:general L-amino acid transport system substrate-binding protein